MQNDLTNCPNASIGMGVDDNGQPDYFGVKCRKTDEVCLAFNSKEERVKINGNYHNCKIYQQN